jgi:hypothetical protein
MNNIVAKPIKYGTKFLNIFAPKLNRIKAPMRPPIAEIINGAKIFLPISFNSFQNAGKAAILPGAVAIKLVAFAESGESPANISAGNVKKVAPPATAFKIPANRPAKNKSNKI